MQIIANSAIFKYYWISDRYGSQDEDEDCLSKHLLDHLCVTDCEGNPTE